MSGWNKCSHVLPDCGQAVLILFEDGRYQIGALFWEYPIQPEESFQPYRYWDDADNDGCGWDSTEVTHWQPLPAPPTE